MSSVLSEYPETLPAPMVGVVNLTERRNISAIGKIRNTRNVQRDRHGTRTVAFTFTPSQAAIFREWWVEWEQRGGGWFAANWPLPWQRGSNVFRFMDPPSWQLIGGGINGEGYWSVRATVEIRGRGMLPTVEVMYLTSTPYPAYAVDEFGVSPTRIGKIKSVEQIDGVSLNINISAASAGGTFTSSITIPAESMQVSCNISNASATGTIFDSVSVPPEALNIGVAISNASAATSLIVYNRYAAEGVSIQPGISSITAG